MKPLLVLQHVDVEHPGIFRDFLTADNIPWEAVELDIGEPIPALDGYAGLWVMGGPMDVWEEAEHPWLVEEKAVIRHAVSELRLPFLGVCLGHQLLADALGGTVAKGQSEVGVMPVDLTPHGVESPFAQGFDQRFDTLQWHGAEVVVPPPAAQVLASSPVCAVQALAIGEHALSAQFHVEVTSATVGEWSAIPAYADALTVAMGPDGVDDLDRQVAAGLASFNAQAKILYDNWMSTTGFRSSRLQETG